MLRLNDLKNFIEISKFPSFSMASKKLEITQPALSESIKRLEKDLNLKLFYRTKNGISLTSQGRNALEEAKLAMDVLRNLGETVETKEMPIITLGCHPVIGSYFMPDFFKTLQKDLPGHRVQLSHGLSRDILTDIQMGNIDIGIVVNPMRHPDLVIKSLCHDRVCVWKSQKQSTQNQLIADPDLFQSQSIMRKWKGRPENLISTSSLELIARMVHKGVGYGIIPERTVKLLKLDLIQVPNTPIYKDEICIVTRPEFITMSFSKVIIDALIKSVPKV